MRAPTKRSYRHLSYPVSGRRGWAVVLLVVLAGIAAPGVARADLAGQVDASTAPDGPGVVAVGDQSTCATGSRLADAAATWCWGNSSKRLIGRRPASDRPNLVGALGPVRDVSVGTAHACAIRRSGPVVCWGSGLRGALGYGSTQSLFFVNRTAAVATGRPTALALTVGGRRESEAFSCALLDDRSVRCWGDGRFGQTGQGATRTVGDDETPASIPPVDLGPGRTATAVAAGGLHACAILDTGDVRCWGVGSSGQLGGGTTSTVGDDETPASVPPVDLGPGRTAKAITAGREFTCVILDTNQVRCWGTGSALGRGDASAVGDDETPGSTPTVDLGPGRTATAIDAGQSHVCAVLDTGDVRCWGAGGTGALGTPGTAVIGDDETPAAAPTVDLGGSPARAVSAGVVHTCADLGTDVACWGAANPYSARILGTGVSRRTAAPGLRRVAFAPRQTAPSTTPDPIVAPVAGTVLVQTRRGGPFRPLRSGRSIPNGSVVDATRGTVRLTTATGPTGTQSARFFDGRFKLTRNSGTTLAVLTLNAPLSCSAGRRARPRAARRKKTTRRLWGDGKGSFRIDGDKGTASAKGTRWFVEDRCDGTVVRVTRGRIVVRDKVRRRSFTLRAGQQRFLPARRSARATRRIPR